MDRLVLLSERTKDGYLTVIEPAVRFFSRIGIHPNVLSVMGLVLSVFAGCVYSTGSFFWGAWVVTLAGVCDTLDGQIARQTNRESPFGAFFDSTLDRYSDMVVFIGLAYCFAGGQGLWDSAEKATKADSSPWTVVVILFAMVGSFMVSYARARAEGLGLECREGLMQRPERIIVLIIGSLLGSIPFAGPYFMKATLLVLALSSNYTALERILYVKRELSKKRHAG